MKKTYIEPKLTQTSLNFERLIATSIDVQSTGFQGSQLVKGDQSSSSSYRGGNHSVWDDDWSQ